MNMKANPQAELDGDFQHGDCKSHAEGFVHEPLHTNFGKGLTDENLRKLFSGSIKSACEISTFTLAVFVTVLFGRLIPMEELNKDATLWTSRIANHPLLPSLNTFMDPESDISKALRETILALPATVRKVPVIHAIACNLLLVELDGVGGAMKAVKERTENALNPKQKSNLPDGLLMAILGGLGGDISGQTESPDDEG